MKKNIYLIQSILTKQSKHQFQNNMYGARHVNSWQFSPIAKMIKALAEYADDYHSRYPDSKLSDDYVLGAYWIESLKGIRGLLNGELDGLDGGLTDSIILDMALNNGFDEERSML